MHHGYIKCSQNGELSEGICELFIIVPCDFCVNIKFFQNKKLIKSRYNLCQLYLNKTGKRL